MNPRPIFYNPYYRPGGRLLGKTAIITGGDSGIGRATAVLFAQEGANVVISYLNERGDAEETKRVIEYLGGSCILVEGDLTEPKMSEEVVARGIEHYDKIDILVNNHGMARAQNSILDISNEQLEKMFKTNIFSYFYMTKAVLPYLGPGSAIISTASVTAYSGSKNLIDYAASKGAVVSFTRSLALSLVDQGIRVNAVSPGPIWTPIAVTTLSSEAVVTYGQNTPMKRAGQPVELAPAYVYLASDDSTYVTGQTIQVNGGSMVTS